MPTEDISPTDIAAVPEHPGLEIARAIAATVRNRHPAQVMAVGAYGSLVHPDERDSTDVKILVVTYRQQAAIVPVAREVDGVIVVTDAIDADTYLGRARTLTDAWPLIADRFLYTLPLYDEVGWHRRLRDAHLSRLAEASGSEFTALAQESWCKAASYYRRARWHSERFDADSALLLLAQARIATALTEGLLTRTYFRSSADAARRTALAGAGIQSIGARIDAHADELAKRGRPIHTEVSELFG